MQAATTNLIDQRSNVYWSSSLADVEEEKEDQLVQERGRQLGSPVFHGSQPVSESRRSATVAPQSKYPPAKPGALEYWPLKAADGVANAAPDQAATKVASKRQRLNCPNIGQPFLVPVMGPYHLFNPPDRRDEIPAQMV
jgi:hypothetical protein